MPARMPIPLSITLIGTSLSTIRTEFMDGLERIIEAEMLEPGQIVRFFRLWKRQATAGEDRPRSSCGCAEFYRHSDRWSRTSDGQLLAI